MSPEKYTTFSHAFCCAGLDLPGFLNSTRPASGGILGSLDLVEGFDDDPGLVDQIGGTHHAHLDLTVVLFLLPHVVGLDDGQLGDRTLQVTCNTC